jgi:heme-degrading monooxygenase HmoA
MKALLVTVLLSLSLAFVGPAAAQPIPDAQRRGPVFVLDARNYPAVTHFLFLETKAAELDHDYKTKVATFLRAVSAQPGFRAAMVLEDIDFKRMVVYYQFESEASYAAARNEPSLRPLVDAILRLSNRFEDYAARPLEQGVAGGPNPNHRSEFRMGDGVGINEARVAEGRTQQELTELMRRAGIAARPDDSPGFIDFTFHQALDGSRNMNLLHWSSVRTMMAGALGPLVQNLINGGLTGDAEGWGPDGPGYIGVHVYSIAAILNGRS